MFGRNPRLPVDIVFGLRKEVKGSNYIKDLVSVFSLEVLELVLVEFPWISNW
jgi:hypothetical protein